MADLEPKIYRQRLIIEGHYSIQADGETIRDYLNKLSKVCEMRIFSGPYSWPPDKWDNPEVKLFELNGFVAWTESGSHVYAWRHCNFFTVDVYSCKKFNTTKVTNFTKKYWKSKDLKHKKINAI
ncbi:MAG: S-adenosylmethionine decarboxylase [Candidatus ainarchaeum sp.]|nr:S-adenosylmethionine decarboxylase [Candidatus ainarchaeum sp.]